MNAELGINARTGAGDWPEGLLFHQAGTTEGGFIVTELWASKEDQEAFMESRLMPAFQNVGLPMPSRIEWFEIVGAFHTH